MIAGALVAQMALQSFFGMFFLMKLFLFFLTSEVVCRNTGNHNHDHTADRC